ncbi:MAG: nucleoside 2-deoxyribosyltransferase domain-containing protein [Cyanobacteria bacterium P01_A01_bin.123]
MKIYFAAPLFSVAERRFNQTLTQQLETLDFQVFLPQRDGVEGDKPPYDTMSREARRQAMFELDTAQIMAADVFLFVLDGRVRDEGACVELGIAYCHKQLQHPEKLLVGLHTDSSSAFIASKLNPMVSVPLDAILHTEKDLLDFLANHRQTSN